MPRAVSAIPALMQARVWSGRCVLFPLPRAIAGLSSLPDRAGDRVVAGCFVPRASRTFA